jgi:BirA family biotin operon repressor/biotin-[acetyl-CoA-carboxylase] ligase
MTFALGPRAISAGYRLFAFDKAGSTNAEAMSRARDGERGPAWFVTSEQTAHETALRRVSMEANLRLAGSDQLNYLLKWPNDILVRKQKLCGLLVEAEAVNGGLAVVAGIGTNIVAAPGGTPTPAVSLSALGVHISAEELFGALSDAWVEFCGIWDKGRGFAEIRRLWLERAAGLGERVAINTGAVTVEGTFDTIDETGCLIVRTADGKRMPVTAGEVYFGSAASVGAA